MMTKPVYLKFLLTSLIFHALLLVYFSQTATPDFIPVGTIQKNFQEHKFKLISNNEEPNRIVKKPITTPKKLIPVKKTPKLVKKKPEKVKKTSPTKQRTKQSNQTGLKKTQSTNKKVANYKEQLKVYLEQNKFYPRIAVRMRHTGTVTVKVEIFSDGRFGAIKVLSPSKFSSLNNAAVKLLKQLGHFKPPVYQDKNDRFFIIPIAYALKGSSL